MKINFFKKILDLQASHLLQSKESDKVSWETILLQTMHHLPNLQPETQL